MSAQTVLLKVCSENVIYCTLLACGQSGGKCAGSNERERLARLASRLLVHFLRCAPPPAAAQRVAELRQALPLILDTASPWSRFQNLPNLPTYPTLPYQALHFRLWLMRPCPGPGEHPNEPASLHAASPGSDLHPDKILTYMRPRPGPGLPTLSNVDPVACGWSGHAWGTRNAHR